MNRCPDLVVCLKRDLQCLWPQASLVLIYRPNVAGTKGTVDLPSPLIEPQICGVEALYTTTRPYSDTTKFNYVLSAVESDILNSVSDLVLKLPENGKYEALKKRLIEVHSESEESKIRTLLQVLELGDLRPSQLLTRMRSLAGDNDGEPLLKSLWLGRLPNGTQTILAALNENLDQLATVADKINDLTFSQGII
ncbi:uncharacterized protein TNCV_3830331 [Trichonephila clavipes]|nr:uncharacterized protein TNCV_3830331 [Trichonephila clavipes]